jgi:hypothetical protein
MLGLKILWCSEPPMPDSVVSVVGAVTLCPEHLDDFGDRLAKAGLVVAYLELSGKE